MCTLTKGHALQRSVSVLGNKRILSQSALLPRHSFTCLLRECNMTVAAGTSPHLGDLAVNTAQIVPSLSIAETKGGVSQAPGGRLIT